MEELRYTLLTDGSSDLALMPIINWLLREKLPECRILPRFASGLGAVGLSLSDRLPVALMMFPCDLLFVHRDAEGASVEKRRKEIDDVMRGRDQVYVAIVPVRMSEAWLMSDESAIRKAAGNKNGQNKLGLPSRRRWEDRPDPKADLERALMNATGRPARRQGRVDIPRQRLLVAEYTDDFSGLRGVPSFDFFEAQLVEKLRDI